MIKFTREHVLLLYHMIVEKTGGAFGIREETLLESAIEAPYQTFNNDEFFPTIIEKAARLGYGLIANHPFIDGNKRIGVYVMLSFLEVNDIIIEFTNEEVVNIALKIASGKMKYEDILLMLKEKIISNY